MDAHVIKALFEFTSRREETESSFSSDSLFLKQDQITPVGLQPVQRIPTRFPKIEKSPGTAHGGEKPYPSGGVVASATRPHRRHSATPLKSRLSPPPANPRFSLSCAAPSLTSAAESETPIWGSPQRTEHPPTPGPISALLSVASGGRLLQISCCFACFICLWCPICRGGGYRSIWRYCPCGSAPIRWGY